MMTKIATYEKWIVAKAVIVVSIIVFIISWNFLFIYLANLYQEAAPLIVLTFSDIAFISMFFGNKMHSFSYIEYAKYCKWAIDRHKKGERLRMKYDAQVDEINEALKQ